MTTEKLAMPDYQALLKDAIVELRRMQADLEALQQQQTEPIALIGMACRFPGGATTPERYWELLASGRDTVQEIPTDRWNVDAYYDADPEIPGKMYTRSGCFLDQVAEFDAQRFGMAPREAIALDPQQRLLLEVTHEALENAGQAIDQLKGSRTGVFVGVCFDDYGRTSVTSGDPTQIDAYSSLGNTRSIAAGRLAYVFGLQGPTLQLDTTCSSSLVALHLASQSLRLRESNLAIVGGVNLILAPEAMIGFCKLKALSPDGHCKPFDASANGYGRSEGCGVVVLKRLSEAIADRDSILAVIRGSAVNHDGASNGLTAPNGLAQAAVIRQALANAEVEPAEIDYVEAHGTGTPLGDPIEVLALADVFAQHRVTPLQIGAVKANIGHLEAAAGVAGLIKLVLSLHHQQIPPHRYHQLNPHVPWDRLPISIPTQLTPWQGDRRLAGLSSFGMSGTNAHVIVENAPELVPIAASIERPLHLLTLSAKKPKALTDLAQKYLDFFNANPTISLADACFSANTGRSHLEYRLSLMAATVEEACDRLRTKLTQPVSKTNLPAKLAFVFTGQDSQYAGMGYPLYCTQPTFRQSFDRCATLLQPYLSQPLATGIDPATSALFLNSPQNAKLTLFAVEYALYQVWRSWGIQPDVIVGEGVGEWVAACVIGRFSLEDALKQVMAQSPDQLTETASQILSASECPVWLEIGSQSIALPPKTDCLQLSGLTPHQSDWRILLSNLSCLYGQGMTIDWAAFDRGYARQRIAIPTYPFQRQRFWRDRLNLPVLQRSSIHPLLGIPINLARSSQVYFETYLSQTMPVFLKHHRVFGQVILPAAAYLEIAWVAGTERLKTQAITLLEIEIHQSWVVPKNANVPLQCVINSPDQSPDQLLSSATPCKFEIVSLDVETDPALHLWETHASGQIKTHCELYDSIVEHKIDLNHYQSQCSEELSVSTFYQQCHEHGIEYGAEFQTIQQLWRGSDRAIAQVQLSPRLLQEAADYAIHPTLLDGCLQAIGALLPPDSGFTYLPIGCQQFTVYQTAAEGLWSLVQWQDQPSLKVDLQLVTASGDRVADLTGLQLKAVATRSHPSPDDLALPIDDWHNWLYQIEWHPTKTLALPTPSDLSQQLAPIFNQLLTQPSFQAYADRLPQLENLSLTYIQQAIAQLGGNFSTGDIFGITDLMQQWAIVPQQQQLFQRLLAILATANRLEIRGDICRVLPHPPPPSPILGEGEPDQSPSPLLGEGFRVRATEVGDTHVIEPSIEQTLLDRTGSQLAAILRGDCDPLNLLFPNGDVSLLTQLYQDSPGALVMNTLIQQAIVQIQSQLPADQPLRILELGAGTGGTTAHVLPHLNSDRTEYVFTDLSPLFLSNAQQKFADYPFVHYERLDLERSPQAQGFQSHQFQVILAANVLHATQDLRQTLSYIHDLLAPGGYLILLEGTLPLRWVDLIFGLTEGWWRFQDTDLRSDHPLISVQQWQALLQTVGFASAIALQPDAYPNPETAFQSLILANAATTPQLTPSHPQNWLILRGTQSNPQAPEPSLGCSLVEQLKQLNHSVQFVEASPELDLVDLLTQTQFDRILDLRSLENSTLAAIHPAQLPTSTQTNCNQLLQLTQAITNPCLATPSQLLIVTQGAIADHTITASGLAQSPLWGMAKVIRLEHPELNLRCLDLDPNQSWKSQVETLLVALFNPSLEEQIIWRQNTWKAARLMPDRALQPNKIAALNDCLIIQSRGNLDTLQFAPTERRSPAAHEVEIRVQATGLNFRDVLNALDLYPGDAGALGCECVGKIIRLGEGVTNLAVGQAVMALATDSFAQSVTVDAAMVVACPADLAPVAAATIPTAFLTAHYALRQLAQVKPGDRVLIHAAVGGVGQAAIQIARQAGAEIFATASLEKQDLVRSLGANYVFNSRSLEFAEQILAVTEGAGVDIILNSLSGEFIAKSCAILQPQGCFLELGKLGIWSSEQFAIAQPEATYYLIDIVALCQQQPDLIQSQLQAIAAQLNAHLLQPLPYQTFARSQVIEAFRWMQQGKHMGKIVITQSEAESAPELKIRGDHTYLITGGLGGLGLQVADWLIQQGANQLVLIGRNPERSPDHLQRLRSMGATIQVVAADVCDRAALSQVVVDIDRSGYPLAGVIHAAGVLADGTLQQLHPTQLAAVMQPKVAGAWHLHQLTAALPLDFFVLFSSATALFGSPGQANHVAANTFLDALAHYRHTQGLPALSINWGTWSQVGAAAARQADTRMQQLGIGPIAPATGQQMLAALFSSRLAQIGVVPIDWAQFLPQFLQQNVSASLVEHFRLNQAQPRRSQSPAAPSAILQTLVTARDRAAVLTDYVRSQIAQILGFQPSEIDPQIGFFDLGMDSLTSVELKSRLQTDLHCTLPTTVAFDYPTLDALIPYLLTQVEPDHPPISNGNPTAIELDLSLSELSTADPDLSDLTEAEIATLLAQELMIH
jgi:acyl transferase domain-containing protein/NADPH:quinone reductase-like Zn-dependent oxidoreductase/SAM-dependent methyltransferase/acyl carrier protein